MTTAHSSGKRFIIHDGENNKYYGVEVFAEYYHPTNFKLTEEQEKSVKTIEKAFGRSEKLSAIRVFDGEVYAATGSHVFVPPKPSRD